VDEETAIQAAEVLTEAYLDQTRTRYISICAPIGDLYEKLAIQGFYHPERKKPTGHKHLQMLNDGEIIICYAQIMYGLMNYYRPADNLSKLKGLIEGLRRSCALTLARKHKKKT
jgi:uncharacterized protein YutD